MSHTTVLRELAVPTALATSAFGDGGAGEAMRERRCDECPPLGGQLLAQISMRFFLSFAVVVRANPPPLSSLWPDAARASGADSEEISR